MNKVLVELEIREDLSFKWGDEFKVVIENCDINIKKIGLFVIEGVIRNQMGYTLNASEKPFAINIPFDKAGEILSAFQRNYNFKVKSMTYWQNCMYAFTEPIHGK